MARRVSSEQMVGRREAVEAVKRSLEALGAGAPLHLVISGEAGVGKTRLLEHARSQPQAAEFTVLSGACFDLGAQSLPLAPFAEILRGLVAAHGLPTIRTLGGPETGALARILPTLAQADDVADAATLVPERLYDALLVLLRRVAERRPLLIQVEDLHDADDGTLDATRYLMRSVHDDPVAFHVTFRSEDLLSRERMRSWLGDVARSARVERVDLAPLSEPEMRELVEAITGEELAPESMAAVVARSDGNPFFAEELLASSVDGSLSASLRDVLTARAAGVAPAARRLLDVAAVGGHEVSHDLLVAMADLDEAMATAHLGDLVAAGLLVPISSETGEAYRFRHALLAEVVRSELLPIERRRLHAAYAAALEAEADSGSPDAIAAVTFAYHLREAGDPRALEASVAAGDAAAGVLAWDVARAEREHALRLLDAFVSRESGPDLGHRDRVGLIESVADAAFMGGDFAAATGLLDVAIREVGDDDRTRLVRLWVAVGESRWRAGDRPGGLEGMRVAVRLAGEQADEVQVRALAGLGQIEMLSGDMPAAGEHAGKAARLARELGLRRFEGHASCTLCIVLAARGETDAAVQAGRAALRIARELDQPYDIGRAYVNLADALWMGGEPEAALALVREALDGSERALGTAYFADIGVGGVLFAFETGDWQAARELLDESRRLASPSPAAQAYRASYELRFLVASGAPEAERSWEAGQHLGEGKVTADQQSLLVGGAIELLTRAGRYDEAVSIVKTQVATADRLEEWVVGYELRCLSAWPLAEIARSPASAGASRKALRTLHEIIAWTGQLIDRTGHPEGSLGRWLRVQRDQVESEIGRARGRSDPERWGSVARAWTDLGRPYRTAYARWRQAQALAEGDDAAAAEPVLREAWTIASRLGARPLMTDLERTARAAGLPHLGDGGPARSSGAPFGLSARELEVLALVAAGHTNREIAERLFISPSTAGVHVSNILGKLGVGSRVEATRIAVSEGLVEATTRR